MPSPSRSPSRRVALALAAALALATGTSSHAAGEPGDRPLRLIVPYAPGGSTDMLARSLAESLRKSLGQPVLVDNKPGANTAIAAQALAAAPPDGNTILLATAATVVLNPLLTPKPTYDPERDFVPVARVATTPLMVVVKPDAAMRTLADLVAQARAHPGKLNYASTGIGSSLHLAGELLQSETGAQFVHVPYKGSGPALTGLLGGETQFFIDAVGSSLPLVKAGKLRALAVTSAQRLPVLPDVPTVAESGIAGTAGFDVGTWFGVVAPRKTPEAVVKRLADAIAQVARDPAFREQFEALGMIVPEPMGTKPFAAYIKAEQARWAPLIKAKNITLE